MSPIEPGEWVELEEDPNPPPLQPEKPVEFVPKSSDYLVTIYRSIADTLEIHPAIVYHPCCATDVSPSTAFSKSRVVYVDLNAAQMEALAKKGFDAHAASAFEFDIPGGADVLILLNPAISPVEIVKRVKIGGYVICNNYSDTASEIRSLPNFELVAAALTVGRKELMIDTEDAADYVTEVQDDAEFERIDQATFKIAQGVRGNAASVLEGYANFLKGGTLFWGAVIMDNNERYDPVPTRKPANVDDFFVFRRLRATL